MTSLRKLMDSAWTKDVCQRIQAKLHSSQRIGSMMKIDQKAGGFLGRKAEDYYRELIRALQARTASIHKLTNEFTIHRPGGDLKLMVFQETFAIHTRGHGDMQDLTDSVSRIIGQSGIKTGTAQVFVVGSTGAIGTIEFEPGLKRDLPEMLDRLIPPSKNYGHEQAWHDGNGHSHLQATLLGPSLSVPVSEGHPVLGTWQQIIHLECDVRSRDRTIVVTVMGE